jgi:hypothetical protein
MSRNYGLPPPNAPRRPLLRTPCDAEMNRIDTVLLSLGGFAAAMLILAIAAVMS